MRRTGRRHSFDYLEENEELQQSYEDCEVFDTDEVDYSTMASEMVQDFEEEPETSTAAKVWITIAKVVLVILLLIGLFFASMKVTQYAISKNQESETYEDESDIPVVTDDYDTTDNTPASTSADDDDDADDADDDTSSTDSTSSSNSKPADKPTDNSADKPADNKPADKPADKPTETPADKPADKPVDKPTETPSTSQTPSEPSKPSTPSIKPGNPAA